MNKQSQFWVNQLIKRSSVWADALWTGITAPVAWPTIAGGALFTPTTEDGRADIQAAGRTMGTVGGALGGTLGALGGGALGSMTGGRGAALGALGGGLSLGTLGYLSSAAQARTGARLANSNVGMRIDPGDQRDHAVRARAAAMDRLSQELYG